MTRARRVVTARAGKQAQTKQTNRQSFRKGFHAVSFGSPPAEVLEDRGVFLPLGSKDTGIDQKADKLFSDFCKSLVCKHLRMAKPGRWRDRGPVKWQSML